MVLGQYNPDDNTFNINGVSCKKQDGHCIDSQAGTMVWDDQNADCAKTHSEVYSGSAEVYESNDGSSQIILIGDNEKSSFAGK